MDREINSDDLITLGQYLSALPIREEYVMRHRLGGVTLKELGDEMKLSRSRVREIQVKAMRRIKRRREREEVLSN